MQLGRKLNPGDFVTLPSFLGEEGKRKDVWAVDEPAGMKNVEHVEDAIDVDSGREWCLGDTRLSPASGMVAYGGHKMGEQRGQEGNSLATY